MSFNIRKKDGAQFATPDKTKQATEETKRFNIRKKEELPEGLSLPTLSDEPKRKAKRPAEAGRIQVEGLPSARSSAPYSLGTSLVSTGKKGLHAIAQAGGDALALGEDIILAPFELLSGQQMGDLSDSAPFNTLARKVREESEATARKYQENMEKGGKAAERLENYGAATIAAVPNAVLAMLTGGGSAAAQTTAGVAKAAAAELTPGVTSTISRAVGSMAKNPQYWASFAQVVGGGYEDAIQEQRAMEAQKALTAELSGTPYTGENENKIRTKAALYAVGNGLLNAAVEIGGGIETLPGELQAGGSAWRAFVDSMVDEGKEEVVQGVIERALKNPVYGAETPVFSTTDENAIFNPRTAAEEFAGGVVVGGLLGGGQIGIAKAADANAARRTGKTLNGMDLSAEDVQAIVDEGLNSATDTAAYRLAVKAKAKLDQGKTLGNYELGRLYQANVDAVEHERVSLPFLEDEDPQAPAKTAQEPSQRVLREGEEQEDTARVEMPPEGLQRVKEAVPETVTAKKPRMEMKDFVNSESPVWNNVEYGDTDTQAAITQTVHKEMMDAGEVVQIPESTTRKTAEAYPDLRDMKKADRTPILREKMNTLKTSLRKFLNGLKGTNFEFEVNGNVLDARLYNTGIREVLEKVNQDKASMLYHSDEIFRNAKYLYSTPDYSGDPNVYRWNYFYSPVQIGDETVGVRIAVRDMQRMTDGKMDSQIYNWGIKKTQPWAVEGGGESRDTTGASSAESPTGGASDMSLTGTTLDGDGRGKNRIPTDVSSVVPETNITQLEGKVNGEKPQKVRNGGLNDGERSERAVSAETGTNIRAGLYAGRQGRVAGPSSAQQGSGVEKSAEARRRAEQSRLAVRRQSRVNALQTAPVSSREAGLSAGTEERTIKIVPEEAYDDAMRSAADRYESHGYRVTYVIGLFTVETPAGAILINGAVEGDRIFIQADNRQWTIDQIGDHELFHTIAADSPGLVQEVREKIMERYSEEEFEKVFAQYAKKYRGVYGDTLAEDSVLGEQEIRDIMEEIFADAYGDKNAFGTNAGQFSAAVEETLEDRGLGRRGRETGEATDRTTGPPSSRYSYGGRYANRADSESLAAAERLEMQGLDPEDIRQETGWFRGMDGKWRFEIDDSGMEYSRWGDMSRTDRAEEQGLLKLSDFIRHDELFQNYPQLRKTGLVFRPLPEGTRGAYSPEQDVITISEDLRHAPEDTLIHEIQHAIQKAEGFSKGSSPEYWKQQRADITETIRAARENLDLWLNDIGYSEYTKSSIDEVISGKKTMDQHWKDLQAYKDQSKYAKQIARCEEELKEYQKQYDSITRRMTPTEQYLNTAGEIEARDAAKRRKLSPEERRLSLPDLGDEKTVFAEDDSGVYGDQGKTKFSMDETVEETRDLLAVHNMGEENLSWALSMGGLPMPSIAVIKAAQGHSKYGPISIVFRKDTIDPKMEKMADEASVRAWIEPQLEDILGEPGIRNTKDPFTPAGRSRSFEELHDPYTLEGIVKAMTDRQDRGAGVWFVDAKSVSSVATPEYKSVPEIKADSGRLQTMDQEAYDMSLRELDQKIEDFKSDIARNMSPVRETVGEALMEGATGKRTDAALKRVFVKYGLGLNPKQAAAAREIYQAAASLPTGYFEGKPERVVKPSEWAMAVVPDDLSPALRQKAEDSGLQLVEYKTGDDADRLRALNSKPELRLSVDEDAEESGNLFRPEGMSDEEYNSLNQKWKEQKKKQRQKVRGDYQAELERRAAEAKDQRMKNVSKEDFTGTPALQRMGVKVENSVGIYKNIHALVESDKAAKSVRKEMRKAERRLHATEAERNFASGIAAGVYSQEDIPRTMNVEKVLELADYFWAERAVSSDMIRQQRSEINKALAEKMGELFKDSDKFKPSRAIVLNNRTPERNMLRIFGDEQGAKINAAIFDPVAVNEAERYRFVNRMFDEVRTFEDSQGKKRPLTKEERALVQQVIEGRAVGEIVAGMEMSAAIQNAAENIRNGGDASDEAKTFSLNREQQRLAIQYARWMETREQLDSGNVDQVKVENAVKKYGDLFNQFYEGINDFLVAHGYEPIGFIKGYAPHLQPEENQNFLNKAFQSLGVNVDVTKLPASIAGRTADYKPNKRWNPYFLSRNSDITKYDIAEAFESYVEYMSDVLYHTDDIMRVRQAANYFRRTYAPEEIRNNLEWAEGLREGTVEEKANFLRDNDVISKTTAMTAADVNRMMDEYVEKLYRDIANTTKYGELVSYLDNYANILAGKQSMADRGWEYSSGRTVLNLGNKLTRAFGKAQVAGNLSSAMNQTAQLPQIAAELGIKHTAKAIRDIAFGKLRKGGWALESDFLTGKKGINYLVSDTSDMVLTAMFKPAELMDGMISTVAVRGKYLKGIQAGKTHREAMKAADDFGKKIMGSRMKGSRPLAFEAKNPVAQMMHIFQVEAVNQWEHLIQDLPRDFRLIEKEKGKNAAVRALAGVILKTLLAAFFLNRASEELYGGTPAPFDLLGLSANFVASGEGLTTNRWLSSVIDNGWEKITGERLFNTEPEATLTPWAYENFDWGTAAEDTGYNISNDIPYLRNAAGLLGLGDQTLPLPDLYGAGSDIVSAIAEDGPFSWETGKALGRAAAEVMPGGRQARKTAQGLETVVRGGKFKGYGDKARLQYPVDGDFFDVVQAMMFGGNGLEETRDFYASGDTGLSAKQTQVYDSLVKGGADRKEVYGTIQAYRRIGGDKNISSYERGVQERETIREADLTDRQKLELYQGLTQADSRTEKFRAMMNTGITWNQVTDIYNKYAELESDEELKASQKAAAFAKWVDGQGLSQKQAAEVKEQLKFYSIIPTKAERYEALSESGLDTEKAYQVTNSLAELEPEDGKEGVSNLQRYEAIANMPLSEGDKEIALEAVMTESAFAKYEAAKGAGIKTSMYCDFLVEIGGMSGEDRQRQVWRYINGLSLNRRQKDALHLAAGYKESTLRDAPWN